MAWIRAVCGRLKSDYRYSKDIVYNNFPWCSPTAEQKAKIEQTAQDILDARAKYPDSSLADLYDELTMPPELRKAHQANDRAVMEAYGFWGKLNTESECVAELMKMYQKLTESAGGEKMEINFMIFWKKNVKDKKDISTKVKKMISDIFPETDEKYINTTFQNEEYQLPYKISSQNDEIIYLKIEHTHSEIRAANILSFVRDNLYRSNQHCNFSNMYL